MSSSESSSAPADAAATTPAPDAAFPTFGSTRGSGLARGKRPTTSAASAAAAPSAEYTPTAIEVVNAPREYTNPFAPAETPAAVTAEPAAAPAPVAPVAPVSIAPAPVAEVAPAPVAPAPVAAESAELNILPPAEQKTSPAQTWESEGFRPARAERSERPRREEARRDERPAEPFDPASIPEKFLYVRPGHTYVPTPTNYGGAPRERSSAPREASAPSAAASSAPAEQSSGGFFGWLKSLFGGAPAPASAPVTAGGEEGEPRREGGQRRHRGGRNRGGHGGGEGGRGRGRGGRGRSGGYRSEGSSQGGI